MEILLASAFTIGLLGSLHCIGMCGGLVSAITMSRDKIWWPGLIGYQVARGFSYVVLGVIIATVGSGIQSNTDIQSSQTWLSYFAAAVMILFALNLGGWLPDPLSRFAGGVMRVTGLGRWSKQASEQDKFAPWLMVGFLNGFLPCGLVYAGLALSLNAPGPIEGGLVMLAFALGTVPAMLAAPYLIRSLAPQLRGVLLKVAAVALIILAIFTASRDLLHGEHQHGSAEHTQHSSQAEPNMQHKHMPSTVPSATDEMHDHHNMQMEMEIPVDVQKSDQLNDGAMQDDMHHHH